MELRKSYFADERNDDLNEIGQSRQGMMLGSLDVRKVQPQIVADAGQPCRAVKKEPSHGKPPTMPIRISAASG